MAIRSGSVNNITKLFKNSKPLGEADYEGYPLYLNKVGLTHISLHNAIELPSVYTDRKRITIERGRNYLGNKNVCLRYILGAGSLVYMLSRHITQLDHLAVSFTAIGYAAHKIVLAL